MAETKKIRGNKKPVGYASPPDGKTFSKDYQPTGKNKSAGKQKRKFTREVLKEMLSLPYKFTPDSAIKQQLIKAFGPEIENMSVAEVMGLQQMQKAILKGDSNAFTAVLNQALGLPKQTLAGDKENPLIPQLPKLNKEQLDKLIDKI